MTDSREQVRTRLVEVAVRLLHEEGPAAVTTRGVAEAAGVQAPTIYRLFGDKDGLMDAVAEHVMTTYVATKADVVAAATSAGVDPLEELRDGWHAHVEFGLANPALFRLLSDPDRVVRSPAARAGHDVLAARVHRVAREGRVRVEERRAVDLLQAAGIGVIHTLLATPADRRDPDLPEAMYDVVLARILTDAPRGATDPVAAAAATLRAEAPDLDALSGPEQQLLGEWLARVLARAR